MNKATITIAVFVVLAISALVLLRAGDLQAPEQDVPSSENGGGLAPMIAEDELAQHDTADDCWVSYNGTVYDITQWVQSDPLSDVLIPTCGTSALFKAAFTAQYGAQVDLLVEKGEFQGTLGVIEGAQS